MADRSVNVLHRGVLNEFEEVLEQLSADVPAGVVLGTDPRRAFAMGADVGEFAELENREQALEMLRRGQGLFKVWEDLDCPTVAAIRGYCLGGGLELALACDYRVAESEPATSIGLPEVRLGIHPGYGGSVRLPLLVGDLRALQMMVTGRIVSGKEALRSGLVDAVAPRRQLHAVAREMLVRCPVPRRATWRNRIPYASAMRRAVVWGYVRNLRSRLPRSHYPAPYRLLEHWQGMDAEPKAAFDAEARSVADLFDSPSSRQLVRMFLLRQTLKDQALKGQALKGQASGGKAAFRVHVVGAGVMGGDIAVWCALQGLRVTLQDTEPERIAPVIKRACKMLATRPEGAQPTLDRLTPDPQGCGIEAADVVIEAVPENLEIKQDLYRRLRERIRPDTLLATNTSSLPLDRLAQVLDEPSRLVGMHFFNPVFRMALVEVIHHHPEQSPLVARATEFVRRIRRIPLVVRSSPGFLVNRVLMPYLMEAVRLLEEGGSAAAIDRAAVDCGMPMGPLKLADTVGLDVCLAAGSVLAEAHGLELPSALRRKVEAGDLGRKTGRGFYRWKNGNVKRGFARKPPADCADRLMLSMVREAVHCLREGLVERADWIDAGLVLGAGFVPSSGGPLALVRERGADTVRRRLEELQRRYGPRFSPGPGWDSEHLNGPAP